VSSIAGNLLVEGRLICGRLDCEGGRIVGLELDESGTAGVGAPIVAPGLVDLHVHGFGGADPLTDLSAMAAALARAGTTAFQPTLFPRAPERLGEDCASVHGAAAALGERSARVVGLHLEGPFVNPRSAGALPVADLAAPSPEGLAAILGPATGDGRGVRTVTLAPELPGAGELIDELAGSGVRVSLGHSLATGAQARSAVGAGAVGVTHLYNAMSGVHHRDSGLASVALVEDVLFAEIIGDLVHVGREAFELALRARGPRGLCLVSDALRGAGTGCDVFHWHGREHEVRDGAAYYPAGTDGEPARLAGSAFSQLEMVRRLVARGVVGLADALTMASEAPARALGLEDELGRLRRGARADLILLEPDGLALREVWVGGCPPAPLSA
jgi:N-acetylglucosamine-6-phosphate deacetylase